MEAKAFPGIEGVLTGHFERQPPRYYEMRLARVSGLLLKDPTNLDHYDDAGVACDRLKRSDEAIAWMDKKAAELAAAAPSPAVKDHQYRYHANIGTFYAHRWFRSGAPRDRLDDLKRAEAKIARAIEINPDAHFGREKYQLAAIRWLLQPPEGDRYMSILDFMLKDGAEQFKAKDAVNGLAGLVVLGDAWQSVDVHWALAQALSAHEDASLRELATLRMRELVADGRQSLDASFNPLDEPLLDGVRAFQADAYNMDQITDYFTRARDAANKWSDARWKYMNERFDRGEHPDTHAATFWKDWHDETVWPALPNTRPLHLDRQRIANIAAALILGAFGLLVYCLWRWRRRKKLAPPPQAPA